MIRRKEVIPKEWWIMYAVGDLVVYENGGVCRVSAIGTPDFLKGNEQYYTLQPVFDNAGTIYVKVQNDKHVLRALKSEKDIKACIDDADGIEPMYESNDKLRDQEFRDAIRSCDYAVWVSVLKGILGEQVRREKLGKHLNMRDERCLNRVMMLLTTEYSVACDVPREDATKIIEGAIH